MSAVWAEIEAAYFAANRAVRQFKGDVPSPEWTRLIDAHREAEARYKMWRPSPKRPHCPTCGQIMGTRQAARG